MSHCCSFFVIDLHSCFVSVYMRPLLHGSTLVKTLLILILITSGSAGNLNEGEGP